MLKFQNGRKGGSNSAFLDWHGLGVCVDGRAHKRQEHPTRTHRLTRSWSRWRPSRADASLTPSRPCQGQTCAPSRRCSPPRCSGVVVSPLVASWPRRERRPGYSACWRSCGLAQRWPGRTPDSCTTVGRNGKLARLSDMTNSKKGVVFTKYLK